MIDDVTDRKGDPAAADKLDLLRCFTPLNEIEFDPNDYDDEAAWNAGKKAAIDCLKDACRMDALLLMAGEMTAQERRTVAAITRGLIAKVEAVHLHAAAAEEPLVPKASTHE
jgi:hypothetical protein